ncbi:hypothetical protein TrRE_jg13456 [Triparma retinervis]|uniref:Uncharacterized protein n=1 Tax=Triparma retinervis TaxID=2557542 RepID=A0A9W7EDZ6_9STRA|nr:hypothetical protein TrRE_jg13456 [Triparma retinervis]
MVSNAFWRSTGSGLNVCMSLATEEEEEEEEEAIPDEAGESLSKQSEGSLPADRPSPIELSDTMDELLDTITNEIRTAGLRKGRENVLVDLVSELRGASRDQRQSCKKAVKEWALFAESTMSSKNRIGRDLDECVVQHERVQKETRLEAERKEAEYSETVKELRGKLAQVTAEFEACKRDAAEERDGHIIASKKREEEMEGRLQREVSRIKSRLAREAEKKAAKCVEGVSAEFMKKIKALKVRVEEGGSFKAKYLESEGVQERMEERMTLEREEWEAERADHSKAVDIMVEENDSLLRNKLEMEKELAMMKEEKVQEIAKQRQKRRVEFEGVEARVREVVSKKEATIRTLLERAESAERRGGQLQKFLDELDENIAA